MSRQQKNSIMSIAFIASTLPAPIIIKNSERWNLTEVIFTRESLVRSFDFLKVNNPNIKFVVCPKGFKHWIFLFYKLFWAKILNKNVFFFHECCWFAFDLLIVFLKIKANFYPQVGLDSFKKTGKVSSNLPKELILLKCFRLHNAFSEYIIPMDNAEGDMYVLSRIAYPKRIISHSVNESILIRKNKIEPNFRSKTKNILILVGREPCSDTIIEEIYSSIIQFLLDKDYIVYVKNHPREEARLSLNMKVNYNEIDPFKPVELLENIYLAVIGCASTGLISFGPNVFSIINFCGMNIDGITERKKHLTCLSPKLNIKFPSSKDELIESILAL